MKKLIKFFADMLSENGTPSSKRVFGGIAILGCLTVIVYDVIKEGMTNNNKDIVEMLIGSSCLLLGITSVTSIWKRGGTEDVEK